MDTHLFDQDFTYIFKITSDILGLSRNSGILNEYGIHKKSSANPPQPKSWQTTDSKLLDFISNLKLKKNCPPKMFNFIFFIFCWETTQAILRDKKTIKNNDVDNIYCLLGDLF